ncbi:MAG: hypothetical protein KGZ25_00405, partial [Planctomycetes bacterium]|nr:hypothetical protein [Planctomycetota bacterium]
MKIVLFEDEHVSDLYPLVFLRAAFDLRCGIFTLKEKIEKKFPEQDLYLETRDELDGVEAEKHGGDWVNSHQAARADDDLLLINAAVILTAESSFYTEKERAGVDENGRLMWAFIKKETLEQIDTPACIGIAQQALEQLPSEKVLDILIRYPWDLVHHSPDQITSDFREYCTPQRKSDPLKGAKMIGPKENIYIGENVELQPHTWIDCREGPVMIDDGVKISAHTSVEAPAYIGTKTQIFEGKIREGCSIGPVCRVGGEVEESIIHGYS